MSILSTQFYCDNMRPSLLLVILMPKLTFASLKYFTSKLEASILLVSFIIIPNMGLRINTMPLFQCSFKSYRLNQFVYLILISWNHTTIWLSHIDSLINLMNMQVMNYNQCNQTSHGCNPYLMSIDIKINLMYFFYENPKGNSSCLISINPSIFNSFENHLHPIGFIPRDKLTFSFFYDSS